MKTAEQKATDFKYRAVNDWHFFPWSWVNQTIPSFGPVHGYLCTILAKYGNGAEKLFLPQKPTMRELARFIEGENDHRLAKDIHSHCERLYGRSNEDRDSIPAEVLYFVTRHYEFNKEFEALMAAKVRLGYFT